MIWLTCVMCILMVLYICMFDINSIQLDSFIMGTNENSKNIHVSHDVTLEEKENLREEKRKKKNKDSIFLKTCKGQKN